MKYAKILGEKEKAVGSVKFDFLALYRPASILGNSNTPAHGTRAGQRRYASVVDREQEEI